jgi:CheY-like chemotaxis protein
MVLGDRRRHRVLVVDDDLDSAEMLCTILALWGHEGRMARTGREALEAASHFDPEIVILDLGLPDISGFEVARALRSGPVQRPMFIIALTGSARAKDREDAMAAEIDQYVVKPANIETLLGMAVQRLAEGSTRIECAPPGRARRPKA